MELYLESIPEEREVLKTVCSPITNFDNAQLLSEQMEKVLIKNKALGLAGNQVGITKRIFLIKLGEDNVETFINPEIIESTGRSKLEEGCLSIPGKRLRVKRKNFLKVKYQDVKGEEKQMVLNGLLAVCFQHELDHLDGKLMTDY